MIRSVRLGFTWVHLLAGAAGFLLVDAGLRGRARLFFKALRAWGIPPEAVRLILVTHVHHDHVGSLAPIAARCGARVAVSALEAPLLSRGALPLPPGLNPAARLAIGLARRYQRLLRRHLAYPPVDADIRLADDTPLEPWGFAARVLATPGHTAGSLTVLTTDGQACVGDLAVNLRPGGRGPFLPPFGDSRIQILESWARLRQAGADVFRPAHGRPFPAQRLDHWLAAPAQTAQLSEGAEEAGNAKP